MTTLGIGLYESVTGPILVDLAARGRDQQFSTNAHGFAGFSCFVPMSLMDSFRLHDRSATIHVKAVYNGLTVWEGRAEIVSLTPEGVTIEALGYWIVLSDMPYIALWSTTRVDAFRPILTVEDANAMPDRFTFDTTGRIGISPQKVASMGNAPVIAGYMGYTVPHGGNRHIATVSFDYSFNAPTNWQAGFQRRDGALAFTANEWTINGNGAVQTGSQNVTLAAVSEGISFFMFYNAANTPYLGESGTHYLRITNLRLKTTTSSVIYANEIAVSMAFYVNFYNPSQMSTNYALVQSPGLDLREEDYQDMTHADVLDHLAEMGDSTTPPRRWEVAVWEGQALTFRPRGTDGKVWYVDAGNIRVDRTTEGMINAAYGVYADASGKGRRTAVGADEQSLLRYGLVRTAAVRVSTTADIQAATQRDMHITDRKDITPRAAVTVTEVYDAAGNRVPLCLVRAGQTMVLRNLPPVLTTRIDKITTFTIAETHYNAERDTMDIVPELPLATLAVFIAQLSAGLRN